MSYHDVITGLEYISYVRGQLPQELKTMTQRLNETRQNLNQIINENKEKQADVIQTLKEVQTQLQNFPQVIANHQSLLQGKISATAGKIRQLNQTMVKQQEELSPSIQAINNYFSRFEQQLENMKTNHMQILAQGINAFNELWQSLDNNNEIIEIAWQGMEQEIEILGQKINSFEDLINDKLDEIKEQLEDSQENINQEIETIFGEELTNLENNLKEKIDNSLTEIKEQVEEFSEANEEKIEELNELIQEKMTDFVEKISTAIDLDSHQQHLEKLHKTFSDHSDDIESLIPKLEHLIKEIEEAGESLNVG